MSTISVLFNTRQNIADKNIMILNFIFVAITFILNIVPLPNNTFVINESVY